MLGEETKKEKNKKRKRRVLIIAIIITCLFLSGASTYVVMRWIAKAVPKTAKKYTETVSIDQNGNISTQTSAKELWEEMKKKGYDIDKYLSSSEELEYLMNAELVTQIPELGEGGELTDPIGDGFGNDGSIIITGSAELQKVLESVSRTICPGSDKDGNNCSYWVKQVFINAGFDKSKLTGTGAKGQYNNWCKSSDRNELKPGMIIAVSNTRRNCNGSDLGTCWYIYWR